nr:MAG TPA: Protein of unknown function (DUF1515) [Caudoviricetes sp.]
MPPDCNDCPMESRIASVERRVEKNEQKASETHKEFYDRIRALEIARAEQGQQYTTILEKLDSLTTTVASIQAKPGKRWEAIVEKSIWAVVAAGIAFLLARIGL